MSWGNPAHSNPSTNQLTEKKHSKRKAPYRPLERTEPLNRKAGCKTEAQSVKKRSTQKKKDHSQVSMRTKTTMIMNKKLGRRRPLRMPYKEPIGRDRSLKINHQEELGSRGQRNSQKKQHSGEKAHSKKNHEKELSLKKKIKAQEKATKGRIWRERSNNAMLKRTEKRKSNHTARDCDKWHLCKAGSFSYGESPRTPPLEGTSLHRWNNSVERPWGILSLFTTCLQVQSPCHSLYHMWTMLQTAHYEDMSPRKH